MPLNNKAIYQQFRGSRYKVPLLLCNEMERFECNEAECCLKLKTRRVPKTGNKIVKKKGTSLTEVRHQMCSGELSVHVSELSFQWDTFMFLMLFRFNSAHFSEIQLVCEGDTDGQTHPLIEMRGRI